MYYFGGKTRIAAKLVAYLESVRNGRVFVEPFVGGASIISRMSGKRLAFDLCKPLITMYHALQNGWTPPTSLAEDEYNELKRQKDPENPLTAFAGFGCSFAGKYFRGYARDKKNRNFARIAHDSLMKKAAKLHDVLFTWASYDDQTFENSLIYCDPPYIGTEKYKSVEEFDHNRFWAIMRQWSTNNTVIISEYTAPDDFTVVLEIPTTTTIRNAHGRLGRTEKLFHYGFGLPH